MGNLWKPQIPREYDDRGFCTRNAWKLLGWGVAIGVPLAFVGMAVDSYLVYWTGRLVGGTLVFLSICGFTARAWDNWVSK